MRTYKYVIHTGLYRSSYKCFHICWVLGFRTWNYEYFLRAISRRNTCDDDYDDKFWKFCWDRQMLTTIDRVTPPPLLRIHRRVPSCQRHYILNSADRLSLLVADKHRNNDTSDCENTLEEYSVTSYLHGFS
jgi:hypothetical protein